jgi:glycosyltransferase involved in cell wall biosynthesis
VVAYLKPLAALGFKIALVSFEKAADLADSRRVLTLAKHLEEAQIFWTPLRYRGSILGKLWNLLEGTWIAWRLARRRGADLFHARSHVAGAIALQARALHGGRLVFDLRGQVAEEYADSGHWRRNGLLYKGTRHLESILLEHCDGLVVLTERLAERIPKRLGRKMAVIPCCVDTAAFGLKIADPPNIFRRFAGRPVLVYAGSIGTWYLLDKMIMFFATLLRSLPDWQLLVLSRSDHDFIMYEALRHGLPKERITIVAESYERMPDYLRSCSAGIAFINPAPSKVGSSPTKIAEYLASGLPIVVNAGVGDLDRFVEQEKIGVVLRSFEPAELDRGVQFLAALSQGRETLRSRCAAAAARLFDLHAVGVDRYSAMYREMSARDCDQDPLLDGAHYC